jgi:hypothetical protein
VCPQCRRHFPREEVEFLQYTETERWDELLKLAGESTRIDYGGGQTSSEQEEEDFIDDDESRWGPVENQACDTYLVSERFDRKAVTIGIKVKKAERMERMKADLLPQRLAARFRTQNRQQERSEGRWRTWF